MNKELENALAFYTPAPEGWFSGAARKMEAAGEWIWETIQGDFNDEQTPGQIVTGTLISMIPLVDQICDVRDIVANCKKIKQEEENTFAWVALVLTLIGFIPTLGSLFKGCLKVLLLLGRKWFLAGTNVASNSALKKSLDSAMTFLNQYLDMAAVQRVLKSLKIHNSYHYLEKKVRTLKETLSLSTLLTIFDDKLADIRRLLDAAVSWGPHSIRQPVADLWDLLLFIRKKADEQLAKALKPATDYLEHVANRLRIEGDNLYRGRVGDNRHKLGGERASKEVEMLEKEQPDWADKGINEIKYEPLAKLSDTQLKKIDQGWPDIRENTTNPVLKEAYDTFDSSMKAVEIAPGEKLYRVIDPSSSDNSICWMREAEFNKLTSKADWRRNYAVWKSWNENGEYVVYTVPKDQPLKVWEGRAATQLNDIDETYSLEGGAIQVVLNPADLKKEFTSARKKTGWGYQDVATDPVEPFMGLPQLETKNNWYVPNKK